MRVPVAMLMNKAQAGRSAGIENFRTAWLPVSSLCHCPKLTWPNGTQSGHERENQPAARRVSRA
jgi:hypothetical protein